VKTETKDSTGANRGNGGRDLCSFHSLLLNSGRGGGGELDFNLLNSGGVNPDASGLVAGKSEMREYKAGFVVGDQEVSQFGDEITVNCAPRV